MPVRWTRRQVSSETYEAAAVVDVDGDGVLDIVSGAFWYRGPDFTRRFPIAAPSRHNEYWDDFSAIVMDVDGDGRPDIVTGGVWGGALRWRQNTGRYDRPWPEHEIARVGPIETTRAWDVDGDGFPELVPNTPGDPLAYWKLERGADGRGTGRFTRHPVLDRPHGHGLGFGDLDGDGRGELVVVDGWLSPPAVPGGAWTHHPEFDLGVASVPIIVADVDGDGVSELVVGNAHGYGLDWWRQRHDGGCREWTRHPIDPFGSQYHDLAWADVDGDGRSELITGMRWRAHDDHDPGAHDDPTLSWFKWNGESFTRMPIACGPLGVGAGCGIHFAVADLRGSGRLDIVAPGKDGLQVFFNEGG